MSCNFPWMLKSDDGNICQLPCGRCLQCRIDKRNAWTDRLCFEIAGSCGSFVTLTYDDDHLPLDQSLHPEHVTKFFKRLRFNLPLGHKKIKYYVVGEYGEDSALIYGLGRCHYHAIICHLDPLLDAKYVSKSWKFGFVKVLPAVRGSIRYTLKYMDKQFDKDDNEFINNRVLPPFAHMSKGIGLDWLKNHSEFVSQVNGYFVNGKLRPLPRYYKTRLGGSDAGQVYSASKIKRLKAYMDDHDCTLNQALNALGLLNEINLVTQQNPTKKYSLLQVFFLI